MLLFCCSHIILLYISSQEDLFTVLFVFIHVRFEVFTAVTMKNDVAWDVTPCGSCKN
jgi:hypothetical protein